MKKYLRILHLEDNKLDVELVREILSLEKISFDLINVDNREDFIKHLKDNTIDIVLADYSLPSFDGINALKLTREMDIDVPFILVSAVMGEELAIEALKTGATDYVLKTRIERLVPAIKRAINEFEERTQRKKLEKEISELEDMYQKIAERVRGFIKMDLPSGTFSLVDKYIEELSGYSTQEWYSTKNILQKMIHPDFQEYYKENLKNMLNGIIPKMLEYKIIRKDGEERWWLQFNIGAYDFKQKLISITIVIIDNTETKDSNLKYQNLFENALVGMFRTSIDTGEIIDANETLAQIFGFSSVEDFKKISTIQLYVDQESRKRFLDDLSKQGYLQSHQMQLVKKDGTPIWVAMNATIYQKEGFLEGVIIDITEKKKAEEELSKKEKELENIFEYTRAMTVIIEEDLTIVKCNQLALQTSGYSSDEVIGKMKWNNMIHPDDLRMVLEYHRQRRTKDGVAPRNYEIRIITKKGKIIPCYVTVGLIPGTRTTVASAMDISDRKKAIEALERERKVFQIIAETAVNAIDIKDLCDRVLKGFIETLKFDSGSISIYYENEKVLRSMANYGFSSEAKKFFEHISIENTDLPLTQFLGKAIFAPDVLEHSFLKNTDIYKEFKYQSFISWPIFSSNKKFLGSIQLGSFQKKDIPDEDKLFFENISKTFASAIERKLTEDALQESEEQYRTLVESLPPYLGVLIVQDNLIKYASPTIFRMLHLKSIKDIIGLDLKLLFSSKERERIERYLNSINQKEITRSKFFLTTFQRADNEQFPVEIYVTPTFFRDESALQILCCEINERKKVEKALQEND